VQKIIKRYIQKVITLVLDSTAESSLELSVLGELKLLFCETVDELFKFCENTRKSVPS